MTFKEKSIFFLLENKILIYTEKKNFFFFNNILI